ncbi:MAG: valine--tRNA ligase [Planctomycetota bacterium]
MSNGGSYDPHAVEPEIYRFWEQGGYFHATPNPAKPPYVIDIPLPNVTGALHLGHALNNTLQDILIRRARMRGFETLWMPGTDHAGIATQAVVEKRLKEEQNLTRHELGREGLVRKIWEWKEEYGSRILQQLRRMGCSCDWERTRFTLDEVCARAVYEVFFQWFKAGLIYRGLRLVNWDAHLQTAVADDEIIHETVKGHLWHYRYPILPDEPAEPSTVLARAVAPEAKPGVDYLVIATTRPETMLGDTAVAVHPDDPRYKHLVGRHCLLPLMNRPIPIIADAELVNPEFGTGCVKVTPAHDPNDYAFSQRHSEARPINILTPDGKINENGGPYAGLDRYAARTKVVADLEALGLMEKVEDYETEIGHSDRSKTPIEPMLSEQWFVKMGDLAETAMEAVRDGRVRFFPERYAKTYLDWLGEKRDWCISRQLWWGHRIPVWHARLRVRDAERRAAGQRVSDWPQRLVADFRTALERYGAAAGCASDFWVEMAADDPSACFVCARSEKARQELAGIESRVHRARNVGLFGNDPPRAVEIAIGDPRHGPDQAVRGLLLQFEQDPDVLDTWFSSALWPFSTLGWPHEEGARGQGVKRSSDGAPSAPRPLGPSAPSPADLDYFYPTTVLVTAREIITLWVARMVLTGLHFTGRVPFSHVYIHPNIQDGQGRRMSKSLGNGVDPLDIIELYGTDALRFTMAQMATETQDARMPVKRTKLPDGREINTSDRFEPARNFCNKLWQAATGFILPNLTVAADGPSADPSRDREGAVRTPDSEVRRSAHGGTPSPDTEVRRHMDARPLRAENLAIEDRWILSRLGACIREADRCFERYQISDVADTLRTFFWGDFCDWYLELVKPRLYDSADSQGARASDSPPSQGGVGGGSGFAPADGGHPPVVLPERGDCDSAAVARQVLAWVLDQSLRLLHPLMPFVTEALWKKLGEAAPRRGLTETRDAEPALIAAAWPDAATYTRDAAVEREMAALQDVIRALRDTLARINTSRAAAKTPAIGKLPHAIIRADNETAAGLRRQRTVLLRLGRCERLEIGADVAKPAESATQVLAGGVEVYVPLAGLMDLATERQRLQKERDTLRGHIERLTGKLANEDFVARAPAAVVEQERARLAEMRARYTTLERNLADLDD